MNGQTSLHPDPFYLAGGPTGILLIHGYTGSPPEMRLIGDYLHQRGLTVSAPLLPGHGTTADDMIQYRWQDWAAHVQQNLDTLRQQCANLFVAGLSLGSLLTLYLAQHNDDLQGIILYSPAVWVADRRIYLTPLLKHFIRSLPKSPESDLTDPQALDRLWSYEVNPVAAAAEVLKLSRQVRRALPHIHTPALILHSTGDTAIHPQSAHRTWQKLGSQQKELITLHNSGHCITVDSEWQTVAEASYAFIQRCLQKSGEQEA